jgi:hypothetical protein
MQAKTIEILDKWRLQSECGKTMNWRGEPRERSQEAAHFESLESAGEFAEQHGIEIVEDFRRYECLTDDGVWRGVWRSALAPSSLRRGVPWREVIDGEPVRYWARADGRFHASDGSVWDDQGRRVDALQALQTLPEEVVIGELTDDGSRFDFRKVPAHWGECEIIARPRKASE